MITNIHQIIATVNPDLYYDAPGKDKMEKKKSMKKFKERMEKEDFLTVAADAIPNPLSQHTIVYDSSSETLEPIYFFILDLMNDFNLKPEKIVDNFASSPGSGHFSELGQRATIMQQQGTKILGDVNNVLRSILNLVYDLKEFKIRLQHYDSLKSEKKEEKEAAILALKQIWMDRVDINKGNSSIKAMALGQAGFQTLIDAFLIVKDETMKGENGKEIDLNDRVKRILVSRIIEFNQWLKESEKELRKRFEIEKTYLKSQVNSVKVYSRWVKPYLKAAQKLEMKEIGREPAMVKTFNTILLELTLFGTSETNLESAYNEGAIPKEALKLSNRNYNSCIIIEFNFRGIPQRVAQQPHYLFGGRAEITFSAYALNEDEIKKVNEELDKLDVEDVLTLLEGMTDASLGELKEDIDSFLEDKDEKPLSKTNDAKEASNPFLALIGKYNEKPSSKTSTSSTSSNAGGTKETKIKSDNFIEKTYLRPYTINSAKNTLFTLFDIYKKSHGMSSWT